jgi:uncharacterized protein YdhG (YjbR/CyaY superfamily)
MTIQANNPLEYIANVPEERRAAFEKLRNVILENLPEGFTETMTYGMIAYAVPHEIYPKGYHCDAKAPLPFVNIASQKNFTAVYHMGIYAMPELLNWFVTAYPKHCKSKLDMGKSCIRFKKTDEIPFALLAELMQKVSVTQWIECYEQTFKR